MTRVRSNPLNNPPEHRNFAKETELLVMTGIADPHAPLFHKSVTGNVYTGEKAAEKALTPSEKREREIVEEIVLLRDGGSSWREVAAKFKIPYSTLVRRYGEAVKKEIERQASLGILSNLHKSTAVIETGLDDERPDVALKAARLAIDAAKALPEQQKETGNTNILIQILGPLFGAQSSTPLVPDGGLAYEYAEDSGDYGSDDVVIEAETEGATGRYPPGG